MHYQAEILQVLLLWQSLTFSSAQFMPFPGQPVGSMGPSGPPQQMQMGPMPMGPMPMGSMPLPMPMPIGLAQPRMPVVVMPYPKHTDTQKKRKKSHKRKKKKHSKRDSDNSCSDSSSSDTDSSSSSSSEDTRRSNRRSGSGDVGQRHQVLTPVISYVTKDGYVVYQKKIKKERAKDWLDLGKNQDTGNQKNIGEYPSAESVQSKETRKQIKKKFKKSHKKHRRHNH